MTGNESANSSQGTTSAAGPYTIYSAGGLFTQDELATNIMIKEAVWRLSNGKFQLFLPQSRELQELDQADLEAYIRDTDLLEVVKADILLVRFDGLELDSGTVVEYMMAKSLGKPTVILRSDFRSVSSLPSCEPYNSMVKNWPRTMEIHQAAAYHSLEPTTIGTYIAHPNPGRILLAGVGGVGAVVCPVLNLVAIRVLELVGPDVAAVARHHASTCEFQQPQFCSA